MNLATSARTAAALVAAVVCSTVISAQTPAQATTVAPQAATQTATAPMARTLRPSAEASSVTQGFSVVLVLGDLQSGSTPDNVPPAAKKALADMKDFLPYRSYRLLDAEWILGSSNVVTRLHGLDDQEYVLNMGASLARETGKGLFVTFQLRDAGAAGDDARAMMTADLVANRVRLERQLELLRQRDADNHPEVAKTQAELAALEKQIVDIESQVGVGRGSSNGVSSGVGQGIGRGVRAGVAPGAPRASNAIISTSFSMDPGETVVVGTSRLRGGDKALIALLTAVPRNKTAGKD